MVAPPDDLGPRFSFVPADVTDEAAVSSVFAAVPGRLDGVVHAAGVSGGGPVHLLDRDRVGPRDRRQPNRHVPGGQGGRWPE